MYRLFKMHSLFNRYNLYSYFNINVLLLDRDAVVNVIEERKAFKHADYV